MVPTIRRQLVCSNPSSGLIWVWEKVPRLCGRSVFRLYASRDLEPGEELEHSFGEDVVTHAVFADRQKLVLQNHGFCCLCAVCERCRDSDARFCAQSDARRKRLAEIYEQCGVPDPDLHCAPENAVENSGGGVVGRSWRSPLCGSIGPITR